MKIWYGYSSEHSSKIMLVGHFKTRELAKEFRAEFCKMQDLAVKNYPEIEKAADRFPDEILDAIIKGKIKFSGAMAVTDVSEFAMPLESTVKGSDFIITSDEFDWGGVLKMLLLAGAKVELFSRHDYEAEYDRMQNRDR